MLWQKYFYSTIDEEDLHCYLLFYFF